MGLWATDLEPERSGLMNLVRSLGEHAGIEHVQCVRMSVEDLQRDPGAAEVLEL